MKKLFLNWKQNGSLQSITEFKNNIHNSNKVVLFPPLPYLTFSQSSKFEIGAQNVSAFNNGAFTGEVGASMLKNCNTKYCLVGHSERRELFKETNENLSLKIKLLKQHGITPILCIGENLYERRENKVFKKLNHQMEIFENNVLIAYEPIWSIGTGITAKIEEIEEISNFIYKNYSIKIIYGGSVSSNNAKNILQLPLISGVLIGGASLKVNEINKILDDTSRC